jgi:hypothetical protein
LMQWPAMLLTLVAAWFVASRSERRRRWGFWLPGQQRGLGRLGRAGRGLGPGRPAVLPGGDEHPGREEECPASG